MKDKEEDKKDIKIPQTCSPFSFGFDYNLVVLLHSGTNHSKNRVFISAQSISISGYDTC